MQIFMRADRMISMTVQETGVPLVHVQETYAKYLHA